MTADFECSGGFVYVYRQQQKEPLFFHLKQACDKSKTRNKSTYTDPENGYS